MLTVEENKLFTEREEDQCQQLLWNFSFKRYLSVGEVYVNNKEKNDIPIISYSVAVMLVTALGTECCLVVFSPRSEF